MTLNQASSLTTTACGGSISTSAMGSGEIEKEEEKIFIGNSQLDYAVETFS